METRMRAARHGLAASLAVLAACAPARAEPAERAIPDDNPAGIRIGIMQAPPGAADARILAAFDALQAGLGIVRPGPPPASTAGPGRVYTQAARSFANDPGYVHLLFTTDAAGAVCHLRAPPGQATRDALPAVMNRCAAELAQPAPAAALPAPPAAAAAVPALHPGNWDGVEGIYFRSLPGTGVGGMMVFSFRPMALFRDGRSFELDDAPLEDVDLAASQRARPVHWGRWTGGGSSFVLMDERGRPHGYELQQGQFFRAFAAGPGGTLSGTYKSVGGGGNSAMGGEMSILFSNRITFGRDGSFTRGSSMAAVGNGSQSGVGIAAGNSRNMPAPGRYALDRHTLVLRLPDGRQERRFFAFASSHTPPVISRDMIFIGGTAFVSDD